MTRPVSGALDPVFRVVSARTGLRFPAHRRAATETVVRRAMGAAGMACVNGYARALEADDELLDELVTEVTVGETHFFREPHQFEFLNHEIFPDLDRRHGPARRWHFWSAGCSSGEEAYSLAILLTDSARGALSSIHGTDIDREALARARAGVYRPWSLRKLDEKLVPRFFRRVGGEWALADQIRRQVMFAGHNLLDPTPLGRKGLMDVVLCRNVLIHFEPGAVERAGRRLFESLAEGGWLITGSSDPLLTDVAPFECITTGSGLCYRRPVRRPRVPVALPRALRPSSGRRIREANPAAGNQDDTPPGREARGVTDGENPPAGLRRAEQRLPDHPMSAPLHLFRALLLSELGRHAAARRAARGAVYLQPAGTAAPLARTGILRRSGCTTTSARRLLEEAASS